MPFGMGYFSKKKKVKAVTPRARMVPTQRRGFDLFDGEIGDEEGQQSQRDPEDEDLVDGGCRAGSWAAAAAAAPEAAVDTASCAWARMVTMTGLQLEIWKRRDQDSLAFAFASGGGGARSLLKHACHRGFVES